MAAILTLPAPPQSGRRLRASSPSFRCSGSTGDEKRDSPPLLKLAITGVTALLSLLSPKNSNSRDGVVVAVVPVARSADDVLGILRSDFDRAYFLTGSFTSDIYAEVCLFEDPTISFRGKDRYSQNLDLLMPFFDSPSLELEKIEKGCTYEMNFIIAAWNLRTYLKFPWRPLISIRGKTIYELDKEFKIVRHAESWNISALEAVGQIFAFGSREADE